MGQNSSNQVVVALLVAICLLSLICPACIAASEPQQQRVAIIGAGIGGATCAYYLHKGSKQYDVSYDIHVFEKSARVGGRIRSFSVLDEPITSAHTSQQQASSASVASTNVNTTSSNVQTPSGAQKKWFELGAAVWSAVNYLIDDLSHELNIEVSKSEEAAGKEDLQILVYEGGPDKRYYSLALADPGNWETLLTAAQMEKFKLHLLENYLEFFPRDYGLNREIEQHKYQPRALIQRGIGRTHAFPNLDAWSKHGRLDLFTTTSTIDFLAAHGVSKNYTWHHIEPLTRVIYDQAATANAFAGLVSLVSADRTRHAEHGLQDMILRIIEASKAQLHLNSPIKTITKLTDKSPNGQKYQILLHDDPTPLYFDNVVLAAPLEFLNIEFVNLDRVNQVPRRQYVGKSSTYIRAKRLNTEWFGLPNDANALLSNANSDHNKVGFFSIAPHHRFQNGDYLYKVFSAQSLSKIPNSLENWFIDGVVIDFQDWEYTFPLLNPPTRYTNPHDCRCPSADDNNSDTGTLYDFQPIVIEEGLYYTSAIDSVAVAMEASALAAHNIAHLIVNGAKKVAPSVASRPSLWESLLKSPFGQWLTNSPVKSISEFLSSALPWRSIGTFLSHYISAGDIYLMSYIGLGILYGVSDLVWIRPRFNSFWLLALLCVGHTIGYWYEVLAIYLAAPDVDTIHAQATLIASEVAAGILVAFGTWLGDAILPLAMLARSVVRLDKWVGLGAIAGVALWPGLSENLLSVLSLVSRFYGGAVPSLSLLDVTLTTAITVSGMALAVGVCATYFSSHSARSVLLLSPVLALPHIGYLFAGEFLGTTSEWTRIVPSHVASYLYQDGLAAIVDPLSSNQTFILILVPLFLIGAYGGSVLSKLRRPNDNAKPHAPRFVGPLRFLGGFLLVIGMAIHSGSYQFVVTYYATTNLLGLL